MSAAEELGYVLVAQSHRAVFKGMVMGDAVQVSLYQCPLCAALVGDDERHFDNPHPVSGLRAHMEWHDQFVQPMNER